MSWSQFVDVPAGATNTEAVALIDSIALDTNNKSPEQEHQLMEAKKFAKTIDFSDVAAFGGTTPHGVRVSVGGHTTPDF